jgi:hypothetical protein
MYVAVPETIGQSGRNRATARDGNNTASHTASTRANSATSKLARRTARSAAR